MRFAGMLVLIFVCCGMAFATEALWRIGECDDNWSEFATAGDHGSYAGRFSGGVTFVVEADDPARMWPYVLPGPADRWAGPVLTEHTIEFYLGSAPAGVYVLEMDLVDVHTAQPPLLDVRLNDLRQSFRLQAGNGDGSLTRASSGREQVLRMFVRDRHLRQGRNVVRLSSSEGSWLLWDDISFASVAEPPQVTLKSARSTAMFRRSEQGVGQVVSASVELWEEVDRLDLRLETAEGLLAQRSFAALSAGEHTLELVLPPDTPRTAARLSAEVRGCVDATDLVIAPRRKWHVYLLPSSHFDIGYTSRQDIALQTHRENIDRAMAMCEKYPDFVWNSECSFIALDYLRHGSRPARFVELARDGRMGVMALLGNELTGICSSESLVRLLDDSDCLRRNHGIDIRCAMMSDVPSLVGTMPMVLAGHGIRYLCHGINPTRARADSAMLDTPHYWQSPDGSRVLTWKTLGYGHCNALLGDGLERARPRVDALLASFEARDDYPYDAVLVHGGYSDNVPNNEALPATVALWNRTYEYPKLVFCRGSEFFEHIEGGFASSVPTLIGDGGVWWEDGAGSSARETAIAREAKRRLAAAEMLVSLCPSDSRRELSARLQEAWENVMLYDEHTWGAAQSVSEPDSGQTRAQWRVKRRFAEAADLQSRKLVRDASALVSARLSAPEGASLLFNPLLNDSPYSQARPLSFLLCSGRSLPQVAEDRMDSIDNRYYRVRLDPATGAVVSIYDRQLERELVEPGQRLSEYLYVTGGEGSRLLACDNSLPEPSLLIQKCSRALLERDENPDYVRVTARIADSPMSYEATRSVTLHSRQKRIDFSIKLAKKPNLAREAGYVAFPFAFANPRVRIGIADGVTVPDDAQTQGACRDWYATDSFVSMADDSAEVVWAPIESPLFTLQDINRGQWYERIAVNTGRLYAYAFNNYWFTNYRAYQEGPLSFRFSMTSGSAFSDSEAAAFAEAVTSPAEAIAIPRAPGGAADLPLDVNLVEVDAPGVVVQAVRPARFADGVVVRLREMDGVCTRALLTIRGIRFGKAYLVDLAEDVLARLRTTDGVLEVPCRPFGLTTVLLEE